MARYKAEDIEFFEGVSEDTIKEVNRFVINNPDKLAIILINNTKDLSYDLLCKIDERVKIRIQGPYDIDRITKQKAINFINQDTQTITPARKYYTYSVIYSRNEVINLLKEIERFEKGLNPNYSDIQKLYYFYDSIKKAITYDPGYKTKTDREIRSLRGLLTKKTVCAGYAVILKELLDRQGIESYFLGGHGHAWNVAKIEDEYIPLDVTAENKLYRMGVLKSNVFFGQNVTQFKKEHIADPKDPHKDLMDKLSSLDRGFVKYLASTVTKEEKFNFTKHNGVNGDKKEYMLVQIGSVVINGETFYKYYYREMADKNNRTVTEPLILVSKINLSNYKDGVDFKDIAKDQVYEDFINKEVLCRRNIEDSLRKGSVYIGSVDSYAGTEKSINIFKKESSDMVKFPKRYKYIRRKDNTNILVEVDEFCLNSKDNRYIRYNIYDLSNKDSVLRKRVVYSELDILKENESIYKLFEEENISKAINNYRGYLGHFDIHGNINHDTTFSFFNSTKPVTIKGFKKNVINVVKMASFDELKDLYQRYRFKEKDYDSIDKVEVLERGTKLEVEDKWTKINAYMALIWAECIGNGLAAFNEENKKIYEEIKEKITENINKTNFINTIELYEYFLPDPRKKEILLNLFSNPNQTRFISEYFYKSLKPEGIINGEPLCLGTEDWANTILEESKAFRK